MHRESAQTSSIWFQVIPALSRQPCLYIVYPRAAFVALLVAIVLLYQQRTR